MMATVLPVDGEDAVDISAIRQRMLQGIPPADVQEYLWRVRLEAEGIPDVVVSDIDPRQFDEKQTANMPTIPAFAEQVDAKLLPSEEWKRNLLADFAELRQLITRWEEIGPPEMDILCEGSPPQKALRTDVPRMSDEDGWQVFFFGKPASSSTNGTPPHLRLLLQFDQVLTRRLLEYHTEWLDNEQQLSRARAVWIYALLARLDKPVHANVAATIRQLLRRCWQLRSRTEVGATMDAQLQALNVLISVTGDFFGQLHEIN